jgi:eukaryotic-like serine/threonine-protein kinase
MLDGAMHSDPILGVTLGGRYLVRQPLAAGGTATIFLAEDLHTGGQVAMKALHPPDRRTAEPIHRLEREGRIAGSLHHPNLCRVTDRGALPDGSPFLVMDILSGETLSDYIKREARLPITEAVDIVHQVLAGLDAAHERGIVHRDVKPENTFLIPLGPRSTLVKLLDFGHAVFQDTSGFEGELTHTGTVVGTPRYMAPEQVRGLRDFDVRTDIYAVGVILYESITGKLPFDGEDSRAVMEDIAFRRPQPARQLRPDLSPALADVIERAMARERRERYATASDLQRALWSALRDAGPAERNQSAQTAVLRPARQVVPHGSTDGATKVQPAPVSSVSPAQVDWNCPTLKFASSAREEEAPAGAPVEGNTMPSTEAPTYDEEHDGADWEPATEKLHLDHVRQRKTP